jgi:hypothetical protein
MDVLSSQAIGRPHCTIDLYELTELMTFYPTLAETACWFKCSEDTIERRIKELSNMTFAEFRLHYSGKTRLLLKRKAITMALENNDQKMLIYCLRGMTDLKDNHTNQVNNEPQTIKLDYNERDL